MVKFNGNRSYFQRAWNERGNYDRRSYFVLVNFCLECTRTDLSMKVDTGAFRTARKSIFKDLTNLGRLK